MQILPLDLTPNPRHDDEAGLTLGGLGGVDGGMRFVIVAPITGRVEHLPIQNALRMIGPPWILRLLLHQPLRPPHTSSVHRFLRNLELTCVRVCMRCLYVWNGYRKEEGAGVSQR